MKMASDQFAEMKAAIDTFLANNPHRRDASMRGRWDALWACCDTGLYSYRQLNRDNLTDAQIDTALRKIIR